MLQSSCHQPRAVHELGAAGQHTSDAQLAGGDRIATLKTMGEPFDELTQEQSDTTLGEVGAWGHRLAMCTEGRRGEDSAIPIQVVPLCATAS